MKLTDSACRNAKSKDKPYKLFDGGGLYLEVMPSGSKLWRLKYRYLGKEKRMSFGAYPIVPLAEARAERDEIKKLLHKDIDPINAKREKKNEAIRNAENTFKAVALEWLDIQSSHWSQGYTEKIKRRLEMHLFPYIGNRPIAQITPPELLECLRKVEKAGALDMAKRARQLAGQIFRYGIQVGKCERDAAADLKGAIRTHQTEHFRTIEAEEIPSLMQAIQRNDARLFERTRRAVLLSLLTFGRPKEIRGARWSHINLEQGIWSIPAPDMKSKRDHIVPLSHQAIAILQAQKLETGHINTDYVFPSQPDPRKPMSDGTVNRALERLGFGEKMVAHGFRALARTTIREKLDYDPEIIELQLAHKTRNPLGEAYDRVKQLDKRREMMQVWADYLDAAANVDITTSYNSKRKA